MPAFCDVALPVPLDRVFTYATGDHTPQVGVRVLVPFRNEKLSGIVMRLHDDPPPVDAKPLIMVMDEQSLLSPQLLDLARWISQYYLAPIGEVLRAMLPLMAEVRRQVLFRITDAGREALFAGAQQGSSRRSRLTAQEQDQEYAVLNYLESGEAARAATLRSKTGASADLLRGMLRKRWLARETVAEARPARRTVRVARLAQSLGGEFRLPRLNANQQTILAALAGTALGIPIPQLRELEVPDSTLGTLVRRGLVIIEDQPADFIVSALPLREHPAFTLNAAQQKALARITDAVDEGGFRPHLLHGVTGSGKTAVYLAAMQHALQRGKSSILLVPEIGLTPQMAAQLHRTFGQEVALLHSALLPEERAEQWHRIRRREARVVVGTRSAIFAPVEDLGLILVDEEHDGSYKQESTPRYHARDVAVIRAKLAGATIVMGSATPSLESWHNAAEGKYARIELHDRVHQRPMPEVELIDMRREFQETGAEQLFSRKLIDETQATLERGEQAIVLLNRRGYSFVVLCRACGEKLQCENCSISLTYHKAVLAPDEPAPVGQRLECHYCGYKRPIPKLCLKCGSEHLYFLGAGSQQGEERLQEIFPSARIGRMDRDTVRGRHDMERLLAKLHAGEINLLVGTQMIAKGHDIHGVTLVGVVGADHALGLPDFRAAERTFQLLTQVAGRAGRGELPGKVIVQTYYPEHYAIECAQRHDFHGFAQREMKYRRWMRYPPFAAITNIVLQSEDFAQLTAWASALGRWFASAEFEDVRVLGPATAPIARIKRMHRMHLLLKSQSRQSLQRVLRLARYHAEELGIPPRNLTIDVDAVHLM